MIKMTFCIHRLPHLTREQFHEHWLHRHAPLVKQFAPALNLRRYVQFHTADHPINAVLRKTRGTGEPFDGIAELWFDSIAAMTAPGSTEAGKAAARALKEDEARFIDAANSILWCGEEHVIIGD